MPDGTFTAIEKAALQDKLENLSIDNATSKTTVANLQTWVLALQKDIKEIKEILINRPTWQVTGILSFLSSLVVALIVLLFTLHSGH